MKLADKISIQLCKFANSGSDIIVPNFYVGRYECDLMKLTKSGLFTEYEIKISRSDFFNDFKKEHQYYEDYLTPILTYNKHNETELGNRANKFYFVVPADLIGVNEVPKYSGLIYYYDQTKWFKIVKNAKTIHKRKDIIDQGNLAYKLSFREVNWRRKLNFYSEEIKRVREYERENKRLLKLVNDLQWEVNYLRNPDDRIFVNKMKQLNKL